MLETSPQGRIDQLWERIDLLSRRLDAQSGSIKSISNILDLQDKQIASLVLRIKELEKNIVRAK